MASAVVAADSAEIPEVLAGLAHEGLRANLVSAAICRKLQSRRKCSDFIEGDDDSVEVEIGFDEPPTPPSSSARVHLYLCLLTYRLKHRPRTNSPSECSCYSVGYIEIEIARTIRARFSHFSDSHRRSVSLSGNMNSSRPTRAERIPRRQAVSRNRAHTVRIADV
jgi:hypothetical protein